MVNKIDKSPLLQRLFPIVLAGLILLVCIFVLVIVVRVLNLLPFTDIVPKFRLTDIVVGSTIYLKTSIDFALFMGLVMSTYPGWRNRIALEAGTALGNLAGTVVILTIWVLFKEVTILLSLMIFLAALVLIRLAEDGLEHVNWQEENKVKRSLFLAVDKFLALILFFAEPIIKRILPHFNLKEKGERSWKSLLGFSFTIPFILGLDDFAGYVPLFNIVNVLGFATGVLIAHTILNLALFLSPTKTIMIVKNSYVAFLGTLIFIGLAFYGIFEAVRILIG